MVRQNFRGRQGALWCENGELRACSWAISSKNQENHYTSLLKMSFILTAEKKNHIA